MQENIIYVPSFEGKYKFLTNFWPSRLHYEGIEYPSVEHAYQAAKTTERQLRQKIASCRTPGEARQLGKKIPIRPDWSKIRVQIMEELVREKFTANPALGAGLRSTYPATIVMGNLSGDRFWGVHNGTGENRLGKILMKIRDELMREEPPTTA